MPQRALALKTRVERERGQTGFWLPPAELAVQSGIREIGDMPGHPRHAETAMRMCPLLEIAPAAPVRIGHHRLPANLVEGDVLRRAAPAAGNRQRRAYPPGISPGPLQRPPA